MVGDVCWIQHGGSGFSFTRADVFEMTWQELIWHIESANERRGAESEAIRRAHKGPGG